MAFRRRESLADLLPAIQKKLTLASLIFFLVFAGLATYPIVFSDFILEGP